MAEGSFYKKVLNYLAEVNKGRHERLLENGELKPEECRRISLILQELGFIEDNNGKVSKKQPD